MCSVPVKLRFFNYCSSFDIPDMWWNYKNMYVTKLQITYDDILTMNIDLSKYESTSTTFAFTNIQCCLSIIRNIVFKIVCVGV